MVTTRIPSISMAEKKVNKLKAEGHLRNLLREKGVVTENLGGNIDAKYNAGMDATASVKKTMFTSIWNKNGAAIKVIIGPASWMLLLNPSENPCRS
jgi:hypothetical protein